MARLGKRERAQRKLDHALDRAQRIRASLVTGVSIKSSLDRWPAAGTSKPGASLHHASVPYKIERPARLGSKLKSRGKARFSLT